MRTFIAFALSLLAFAASPAAAQIEVSISEDGKTTTITEYYVEDGNQRILVHPPAPIPRGIARFGPFRVIDATHAVLVDTTDARSPMQFEAMLAAYPGITELALVEVPGTEDDKANMRLGRMIHDRGIVTRVPAGGSVRSGGVELFLAGKRRVAEPGSEFAVHAWEDDEGRQATDYAATAPENRAYVDYYMEMGMSEDQAKAFYAMTNSVPFEDARYLTDKDMGQWVKLD
jgi:hypothetical protein